jgi:hypothetical protein
VSIPTSIHRGHQLDAALTTAPLEVHDYLSEVGPDHVVRPVNWNTLTADEAEHEWLDLNRWAVPRRHHTLKTPDGRTHGTWVRPSGMSWDITRSG